MLADWLTNTYFQWPFKTTDVTSVRTETFNLSTALSRTGAPHPPSAPSRNRSGLPLLRGRAMVTVWFKGRSARSG
jgi:hypothetical protein